jgi:hypothetical protein
MQVVWANDAGSTLASPITNSATTLTVASGTGSILPTLSSGQFFPITLRSAANNALYEVAYCTARSGDVLTVTRGQESTTPLAFSTGDLVQNLVTAGTLADFQQNIHGTASYSSPGTHTWTVPVGVIQPRVRVWGGGGGGGGGAPGQDAGGGGAGGGYTEGVFSVTPGASITVIVGDGGVGGTPGNPGNSGGSSSFGSLCSATGGAAGAAAAAGSVGSGGTPGGSGSGGALNVTGGDGLSGAEQGGLYFGGTGGWAAFAVGTTPPPYTTGQGNNAGIAGGGSGGCNGGGGGIGGNGLVVVTW